jgi:hypothetical protein
MVGGYGAEMVPYAEISTSALLQSNPVGHDILAAVRLDGLEAAGPDLDPSALKFEETTIWS